VPLQSPQLNRSKPIEHAALARSGVLSFGFRRSATHIHNGVDIPARAGTPVLAAADGIVRFAERAWRQGFSRYGRVVALEHADGTWTLYAHLNEVIASPGEHVLAGQMIGTVGRTEFSRTDHSSVFPPGREHLHFEVSPRAYPQMSDAPRLDPIAWLDGAESERPNAARPKALERIPRS
jgi:murein DD-endopeptidase MepM/ murein hydrolase activator NlpD